MATEGGGGGGGEEERREGGSWEGREGGGDGLGPFTAGARLEPGRNDDGKPQAKKNQWSRSRTPTEGLAAVASAIFFSLSLTLFQIFSLFSLTTYLSFTVAASPR